MSSAPFVSAVKSVVAQALHDRGHGKALDGVILPGTYDPTEGVVDVVDLESLAQVDEDDSAAQPMVWRRIQLLTSANGFQSGPRGGERVVVIQGASGDRAILEHGTDDTPGALAGEHHLVHRQSSPQLGTPGAIDAFVRLLNDAKSQGDGKAALNVLAGGLLTILTTAEAGIVADDQAGTVTIGLAGNAPKIIWTSSEIKIGKPGGTMSGISPYDDVNQAIQDLRTATQTAITQLAAIVQSGSGVPPPQIAPVTLKTASDVVSDD